MKLPLHLTSTTGNDRAASSWRSRRGCFLRILPIFLSLLALAAGCKKKETAPAPPQATADQPPANPPSPRGPVTIGTVTPAPVVIPAADNINDTLNQLSTELRRYVVRTRSVPKNFEEFIAKSLVQAPAAPDGKKYAIQNHAVVLVTR